MDQLDAENSPMTLKATGRDEIRLKDAVRKFDGEEVRRILESEPIDPDRVDRVGKELIFSW